MLNLKLSQNKKKILIIVVALAIVIASISIIEYKNNNYSGSDISKYAGKWKMLEIWQSGYMVSYGKNGFQNIYVTIKKMVAGYIMMWTMMKNIRGCRDSK